MTGAIPAVAANAPDEAYNVEHFRYEAVGDYYVCPQGSELHTNGTWYQSKSATFKQYKTPDCKTYPVRELCTTSIKNGKIVQRNKYVEYIEANKIRIQQNQNYYRRRQAIVEHPGVYPDLISEAQLKGSGASTTPWPRKPSNALQLM